MHNPERLLPTPARKGRYPLTEPATWRPGADRVTRKLSQFSHLASTAQSVFCNLSSLLIRWQVEVDHLTASTSRRPERVRNVLTVPEGTSRSISRLVSAG